MTSAGRIPAADIPLSIVVFPAGNCIGACGMTSSVTQLDTVSGADGIYRFDRLPLGPATVFPRSPLHRQLCGAGADLRAGDTRLDVHVTSAAGVQRSPFLTPLEISGQVYETTVAGRVGVSGATIRIDHHFPGGQFLDVTTDDRGFYTACGVPLRWPLGFDAHKTGFRQVYSWHAFGGNTTVDIELRRER